MTSPRARIIARSMAFSSSLTLRPVVRSAPNLLLRPSWRLYGRCALEEVFGRQWDVSPLPERAG
jgi:hypothetical protein